MGETKRGRNRCLDGSKARYDREWHANICTSRAFSSRYARAATKSKSAFDAKRAAAAATKAARLHSSTSVSLASVGEIRCSIRHSEESCRARSIPSSNQDDKREKGERSAVAAASWRGKLAAVQRRRAALECSMKEEAKRLVERRAKKEVLFAVVYPSHVQEQHTRTSQA